MLALFSLLGSCTATLDVDALSAGRMADPRSFSCQDQRPAATFCDDFEPPTTADGWSEQVIAPAVPLGGSIVVDDQAARAGARSLLAVTHEGIGQVPWFAVGQAKTFPQFEDQPVHIEVDFDVRVEHFDPRPGHQVMLFQLLFGTQKSGYNQLTLQLESRGASLAVRVLENDTPAPEQNAETSSQAEDYRPAPAVGQWAHVRFALDVVDPAGSDPRLPNEAFLAVDELVLLERPLAFPLRALQPRLEIGLPWVDSSGFGDQEKSASWRVRFDNVLVRIFPR